MFIKFRLPIIAASITFFVLMLMIGSFAQAQVDNDQGRSVSVGQAISKPVASPVPGGPGYISVSSYAFQPYFPTDQYTRFGQLLECEQSECLFSAGISLPHGATITKFVAYYYDNSNEDIQSNLKRGYFDSDWPTIMANIISQGTGTTNRYSETTTIIDQVIDNQSYVYYIEAWLHGNDHLTRLIGVRVDYDYPAQLPLIQK